MRLQFAQGRGDPRLALGEAGREGPDVDERAARQGLDVHRQADGQQRQLGVLGQVVADHREAAGVAGVVVDDATGTRFRAGAPGRVVFLAVTGLGVRAHASVLGIHQEAVLFLGGQAPASGFALPAGADACQRWCGLSR